MLNFNFSLVTVVAKQAVSSSSREVGTSTGVFVFHLLQNENCDFLVTLTSSDLIMTRLVFKSMFRSKSHVSLMNPLKQAALLCSTLPRVAALSFMERRWHCLALSDSFSL